MAGVRNNRGRQMKPTLILIGADKGGVGKTTTARALLDFLARRNIMARAFDTENPRGTLRRFYPGITEVIDLGQVADQMKVLDTLESAAVKVTVVDLKAGSMSNALATFENIGVLEAARSGQFDLGLFHVVGPAIASLDEMGEVAKFTKGIHYIVARNFINETNFFEWDDKTYKKYFAGLSNAREIEIPKLNEMAYEQVEVSSVPFLKFVANKGKDDEAANYSFVLRGYVRHWLANVWSEFDRIKLTDLVGAGKSVVRGGEK